MREVPRLCSQWERLDKATFLGCLSESLCRLVLVLGLEVIVNASRARLGPRGKAMETVIQEQL
eukprot:5248738-Lingulodinium_polyedra.AAC.1